MIRDVIYGTKDEKPGFGQCVELFMFEEDNHLGIDWTDDGHATVFHFLIKDKDDYEDFKNELTSVLRDCKDMGEAYYELEAYLNSEYADDFLEEYPEYEPEMRTEEAIGEYMSEAHDRVWLVRRQNHVCSLLSGEESISLDILDGMNKAIDEVCKKYNIDFQEPVSDWEYGYWSGILAALRWVMGDEKDCLDT
jgi:hypothetical protein